MKSIETRLADLEKAIEAATAEERIVQVVFCIVSNRAEAEALDALRDRDPPRDPPPARGRIRLVVVGDTSAVDYLRANGVTLPTTETTEGKDFSNE